MATKQQQLEKWQLDGKYREVDTQWPPADGGIRLTDFALLAQEAVTMGCTFDELAYGTWRGFDDGRAALIWLRYDFLPLLEDPRDEDEDPADLPEEPADLPPFLRPLALMMEHEIDQPDPENIDWVDIEMEMETTLQDRFTEAVLVGYGRVTEILKERWDDLDYPEYLAQEELRAPGVEPEAGEEDLEPAPFGEADLARARDGKLDVQSPVDRLLANLVLAASQMEG